MGKSNYELDNLETRALSSYKTGHLETLNYLSKSVYQTLASLYSAKSDSNDERGYTTSKFDRELLKAYASTLASLEYLSGKISSMRGLTDISPMEGGSGKNIGKAGKECRKCGRQHNNQGGLCDICSTEYKRDQNNDSFSMTLKKYLGQSTTITDSMLARENLFKQLYYQKKEDDRNQTKLPDFYFRLGGQEIYN